jgi:hypothetical protein
METSKEAWIFGVLIEASILTQDITLIEKLNLFISRQLASLKQD